MPQDQDYNASGFNNLLSRDIGNSNLQGSSMDQQTTSNNAVAFDRTQISGAVGDVYKVGNIIFDGKNGTITINDDSSAAAIVFNGADKRIEVHDTNNNRLIIGQLPDTQYGWAVSKAGSDVENGIS